MSDRIKRSILAVVEALLGPRIDRCALYPGRIVSVSGGGPYELDVVLDDSRWPGLTRVPLRPPIPAAHVEPVTGSRVLVGWEPSAPADAGTPQPYALPVWGPSGPPTSIEVEAVDSVTVDAPDIALGRAASSKAARANNLDVHLTAIATDIKAIASALGIPTPSYGLDQKELLDISAPIAAEKVRVE